MLWRSIGIAALAGGAWLSAAGADRAVAQDAAAFYAGKSITMLVGSDAGGGYDLYARLLTRHMGNHIPGQPTFVTQNMPGAGSIKAANYVYNVARQDGSVIAALVRTAPLAQILGQSGPQYEAKGFHWLGSLNNEAGVVRVVQAAPVTGFADLRMTTVILGAQATGTDTEVFPLLMNNTLGTKFRIVKGYVSGPAIDLAIERGEVQGQADSLSSMTARYPDWKTRFKVLAQLSHERQPDLPGVPTVLELIDAQSVNPALKVEDVRAMWEIMLAQRVVGRPFAVAPNVPADRVAVLRAAFKAVINDPAFRADSTKSKIEVVGVDGDTVQGMIAKAASASPAVIEQLNRALKEGGAAK